MTSFSKLFKRSSSLAFEPWTFNFKCRDRLPSTWLDTSTIHSRTTTNYRIIKKSRVQRSARDRDAQTIRSDDIKKKGNTFSRSTSDSIFDLANLLILISVSRIERSKPEILSLDSATSSFHSFAPKSTRNFSTFFPSKRINDSLFSYPSDSSVCKRSRSSNFREIKRTNETDFCRKMCFCFWFHSPGRFQPISARCCADGTLYFHEPSTADTIIHITGALLSVHPLDC